MPIMASMSTIKSTLRPLLRVGVRFPAPRAISRRQSTGLPSIDELFATPSWSVKSLLDKPPINEVAPKQLRHLLRLSALAEPESPAEEEKLLKALNEHINFVREIQQVDTTGVEPLSAIRDETPEAIHERTITPDSVRHVLDQEEVFGEDGRIQTIRPLRETASGSDEWNVLGLAERKVSRYFVVEKPVEAPASGPTEPSHEKISP